MSKVTLFLMSQKGFNTFTETVDDFGHLFGRVVIGRDPAVADDFSAQIQSACESKSIPYSFRSHKVVEVISTEYALAIGWRWLIDFPQDRLIVFHDSLLPLYRGFNPLVTALINGDEQTGVTALLASERYDAGPILEQSALPLKYPITIGSAIDKIGACYADVAKRLFRAIAEGRQLIGVAQDERAASYSLWRDAEDYRIDWKRGAQEISRTIDALGKPYAGAETFLNQRLMKLKRAVALPDVSISNRTPGKVIWIDGSFPVVVCGSGLLRVEELVDAATGQSALPLPQFRSRFS